MEARLSRGDLHGEGRASARPQWKWRVERRLAWQGGQPRPAQKEQTGRLACGRRPTLKTKKTAPRPWKEGGKADVQSGRGRPARGASGKRETSGMTPSPLQKRGGGRWKGKPRAGACGVDGPGGGVASAGAFAKAREVLPGPRARERIDSHPVLCRMPSNTMVWSCRSPADVPRGLRLADEQRGNHC